MFLCEKSNFLKPLAVLKLSKCFVILLIATLFTSPAKSQTTNISGIVNTYHKVIQIIPAKACVRVNNPAGLILFRKVMIIQMKGASVVTANNSSFGDTTSLNFAGNYEIGTICGIRGDSVFLFHNVLNQYTINDKVQLVQFGEYFSATVVDTLKAASWDNNAGTGGVLAISVDETLTLNAPIYADSTGYKGGEYRLSNGTCGNGFPVASASAYHYDANILSPQNGSFKGEGVFELSDANSGGRGAAANGGGGGNNHNNGGGGGANLSNGGIGGGNSSSAGCLVTLQGRGGKALSNYGGQKIFPGGGGGAGHSNGTLTVSDGGGHGGAIIFLFAKTLIGNNQKITANGLQGGTAYADGASGGGAGGTIIMNVLTYSDNVFIEAKGGNGGNENDDGNIQRCFGSGGGGSGGVIYFSGAIPAITTAVSGGLSGSALNSDPACNPPVPASDGINGQIITNYPYSRSLTPASYCAYLLPVRLISFTATSIELKVQLSWKISQPELADRFVIERSGTGNDWDVITAVNASDRIDSYQYTDANPRQGKSIYRLRTIGKNNGVWYSALQYIFIGDKDKTLIIYPNPAKNKIIISGYFSFPTEMKLFDASGKMLVLQKLIGNNGATEIYLPLLSPGIYIIQVNEMRKKLVIR